ncbi:MAG: OsmC family protein [Halobacteria archaeon]
MAIKHGVDTAEFEEFTQHAAENPEEVQFELTAKSIYEGTVAHSLAKVDSYKVGGEEIERETREYTVPFGAWREVLDAGGWTGPTDRPEPIEMALSALASCINVGISMNALATGADIDELRTHIKTDFDPAVLFSLKDLDEADEVFENLEAEIEIEGEGIHEEEVEEWAQRAPVFTMIALGQDVDISIDTTTMVAADD